MSDSFITYLVLQRMKTELAKALVASVPAGDATRVDQVKIGRFQDDPNKKNIFISISGGSQTDPELLDAILTQKSMENIAVHVPPREVGGGQLWWRRGEVKVGVFLIQGGYDEEKAASIAYTVFGRLQATIETIRVSDLVDSFGERALKLFCFASNFMESGGPPDKYIWRGSVKWQFLSERG